MRERGAGGYRSSRSTFRDTVFQTYNLPPQTIKATDSRAAGFQQRFGAKAATVELDALPVAVLRGRVEDAIKVKIEWERWRRQVTVEEVELKSIGDFVNTVRNLPQAPQ